MNNNVYRASVKSELEMSGESSVQHTSVFVFKMPDNKSVEDPKLDNCCSLWQ